MPGQRGLVMLSVPDEDAQRIDYLVRRFEIPPEAAIRACVSAMIGMLEGQDARALRFMSAVHDQVHREIETALVVPARSA